MISHMREGDAPELLPPGTPRRAPLHDVRGREVSEIFKLLAEPSHQPAAWLLNQLYLSLPRPDANWASDCQTKNFHTRLWEALLLASFREQGIKVTQPYPSPDFMIERPDGETAWIEAVTINPALPYEHVGAPVSEAPEDIRERMFGAPAVRYAKSIRSKLQRRYDRLPHVEGKPFVLAIADFQSGASMTWSREALITYLYGTFAHVKEVGGRPTAASRDIEYLRGDEKIPAGLFRNQAEIALSAIIFTNACSLGKLNRVGVSMGMKTPGLRYLRVGEFFDRSEGALVGIPFIFDVASDAYRSLWPQHYEPWCAELEVFHNPQALHPLPHRLVPEATHWFDVGGEIVCNSHYEHAILRSRTIIQKDSDPLPTLEKIASRGFQPRASDCS
jgi:hypothetical protein